MKKPSRVRTIAALVLLPAAVVLASSEPLAQTVTSFAINKIRQFEQTSATNVVTASCVDCPFRFLGIVGGQNLASMPAPILSGPIDSAGLGAAWNNGRFIYAAWDGHWHFGSEHDWGAATEAELDARFGSGLYTITVNGIPVSVNLSGATYPNAPVLTLEGGAWRDGKYVIDASRPLTITTNAHVSFGSTPFDAIFINTDRFGYVQGNLPGPNTLMHTLPAHTFVNGNEYPVWATFISNADWSNPAAFPGSYANAAYGSSTFVTIKAEAAAPVFPMTVSANIGPVVSSASAVIQYRPQDVGSVGSVFVFAVAPASIVANAASEPGNPLRMKATAGGKEGDVQCVLAQLSSSGQLVAVSPSSLQAYITGVLTAQAQAVTIINGVPTVNIGGAVFYVGYGASASAMLNGGINRRAVTVPGSLQCDPKPPQTGWWWNPLQDGRGYSIEVHGNNLFFASFLYDVTGRSSWYVATGPVSLDGSLFNNELMGARGGQALGGAYTGFPTLRNEGPISLAFNNASTGTLVWPGGAVPIQRFNIVPDGLNKPAVPNQPESGWWWNESEAGRGFFLEWQGGILNIAGYMYDLEGNPVWYLTQNATPTTNAQSFSGNWWSFGNGMTLMGPWRPHTRIDDNVAPVTIQFQGSENAIMTLPNGRTTALTRHRF